MSELASVTHIAGADLTIAGRRMRQRCAWCGAVLIDMDLARVSVQIEQCRTCNVDSDGTRIYPDGQGATGCPNCKGTGDEPPKPPATWPCGRLVRVTGEGGFRVYAVLDEADQLPDDACASVDDAVTE